MIPQQYPVYKGLQRPLVYKGLKGRFIYWGVASIVVSILLGGLLGALAGMLLGCTAMAISATCGIGYTLLRQKKGLYDKTRNKGIFVHQNKISISYETIPKDSI